MAALTWRACALRRHPTPNEGIYGPGRRSISITIAVPTLSIIMTERMADRNTQNYCRRHFLGFFPINHRMVKSSPCFSLQACMPPPVGVLGPIVNWANARSMEHVVTASTAHRHIWEFEQVQRQLRARPCAADPEAAGAKFKQRSVTDLAQSPTGWLEEEWRPTKQCSLRGVLFQRMNNDRLTNSTSNQEQNEQGL